MPKLVERRAAAGAAPGVGLEARIVDDPWVRIDAAEALLAAHPEAPVLVPLAVLKDALATRRGPVGAWLFGTDDPADLATVVDHDLTRIAIVAIDFPKFTDGRGYSIARLLRERVGYRGPLLATGDVLRDQLFYLARCGFDAFALKHQDRLDDALSAFEVFTDGYQTSVDRPLPWFRRRAAALAGAAP